MPIPSIPVLFCANGPYFQHAAVTIASLLTNNRARHFDLTIATDQAYPAEESKLQTMVAAFGNATLRVAVFGLERMTGLPTRLHLTLLMYLRLFAANILGPEIGRVLYLDTDLVVCADIADLWTTDMDDHAIACAPDIYGGATYANSGVMILNLDLWRCENAQEKLLGYIRTHSDLAYPDQDALNTVFAGRIKMLPLRWNFQARMAEAKPHLLGLSKAEFLALRKHPGIVHYTTGSKPWMYRKDVHYTPLYHQYLALTPWRGYHAPDKTLRRRVSKAIRLISVRRWLRVIGAAW